MVLRTCVATALILALAGCHEAAEQPKVETGQIERAESVASCGPASGIQVCSNDGGWICGNQGGGPPCTATGMGGNCCTCDSAGGPWPHVCGSDCLACGNANTTGVNCSGNAQPAAIACVVTCTANHLNCDNDGTNGCEVDIHTDHGNCGACGTVCSGASNRCVTGACACGGGAACDADAGLLCWGSSPGGTCAACTTGMTCKPANPCHGGVTTCGPTGTQTCSDNGTSVSDGTDCDDANKCNGISTCQSGTCTQTTPPVTCNSPPACRVAAGASCDTGTGTCTYPNAAADGIDCDDANKCNGISTCQSGSCTQTTPPVTCKSPSTCHTATGATCAQATGVCSYPNAADGTDCDDNNKCNGISTCQIGACTQTTPPVTCASPPACHTATGATCVQATGVCTYPNLTNGTSCGLNKVCDNGSCVACTVGQACTPANPCHAGTIACGTGAPVCMDTGNAANGTACGANRVCNNGTCVQCFSGQNCTPANFCHVGSTSCSTGTQTCSDTGNNVANGTVCAAGQICNAGTCQAGCWIGGTFYTPGTASSGNSCRVCTPGTSTTGWSNAAPGTSCGAAVICNAGTCVSGCYINGTFRAAGLTNPANDCQVCTPATSTSAWTAKPDNTPCGTAKLCNAGGCGTGCTIASTPYGNGVTNPLNACQICQSSTSTTAWTDLSDGTACATGQVCHAATCQLGCWIGSAFYVPDAKNSANGCETCAPGTSTTAWTTAADGSSCAVGQVCTSGTCTAGCWIDGAYHASAAPDPANVCESCQPATSTSAWTAFGNGTICGAGLVCYSAACSAGCWIGSAFHASAEPDSAEPCQVCQPATSTSAWTMRADGTDCAAGEVCNRGLCSSGCWIDNALQLAGTANGPCQTCQPATSTVAWSPVADGTCCGDHSCRNGTCSGPPCATADGGPVVVGDGGHGINVYNLGGCGCSQTASPGLTAVFVLMATTWWGARRRRG